MLNVSAEWRRDVLLNDNRNYLAYADITFTDGKKISLDNSDIWSGGFSIEDSTSENDKFTVGALVSSKLKLKINNIYETYSEYDFTDARVSTYIGKELGSELEKLKIGEFTVSDTSYDGSIITLTCLDNVNKFNKAYDTALAYPTTVYDIIRDACVRCGVVFNVGKFDNSTFVVSEKPDSKQTYGKVIANALQICGLWGKCDHEGTLIVGWYDSFLFEEKNYHGGTFKTATTPYSDGDTLNGGNFTDYSSGDSASGGTFQETRSYHNIFGEKELSIATDDVVVTGVKVTITSKEQEKDNIEYLAGEEGYVYNVQDNPLITTSAQAKTVADFLYKKIGIMRFRPLSGSFLSDPTIEAGDMALVNDRKRNSYVAFISNRTFSLGSATKISCDAESPARNSAKTYSAYADAVIQARKTAQKQITTYDAQMQLLTQLMAQSFGLFKTEQKQDDGSVIYIMHNKSDLSSSQIQWKMTADGMAVSSDYGKTWNAGIDKDGNAIFNIMSAIGINFDWAHGGTLTLGGENNTNGVQYVKDAKGNTLITLDNKGITLASGVKISWDNISNQPTIPTNNNQLANGAGYQTSSQVTQITKNTVTTEYVNALEVKAGSVDAEDITGTKIKGKTFEAGSISGGTINIGNGTFTVDSSGKVTSSNMNITGGDISLVGDSIAKSKITISYTNSSGATSQLKLSAGQLEFYLNGQRKLLFYAPLGTIYASSAITTDTYIEAKDSVRAPKVSASESVVSPQFQESGRGTAMAGHVAGHTYHCDWDGTALWFEVDDTWVWNSSDKRLKKNIQSIQGEYISAIGAVDLVQYNLNRENYSDKELYFGAIAQDVVAELESRGLNDENIKLLSKKKVSDDSNELYYGMDYEQFLLLRLAHDEKRITELEERNRQLSEKISKIYEKLGIEEV